MMPIPRLRDRAEPHSTLNSEGFREQALSGSILQLFLFNHLAHSAFDLGCFLQFQKRAQFLEDEVDVQPLALALKNAADTAATTGLPPTASGLYNEDDN